jgi:peptidoglycan hydrolase CwlO-like protein
LRIEALERKLHVIHAFVESHEFTMRDFKREVRDEKRFEQLLSQAEQTKNSSDKNMQEIVKLKEGMAKLGTQIKELNNQTKVSSD